MKIRSRYVPLKARYIEKIPSEKHVHGNRKHIHAHTHTGPTTDIISDPCVKLCHYFKWEKYQLFDKRFRRKLCPTFIRTYTA